MPSSLPDSAVATLPPGRRSWVLVGTALLAVVQLPLGLLAPPVRPAPRTHPLLVARGVANYPEHAGFADNAVYPITPPAADYPGVECFGSWLGGDASTGRLVTLWFRPGDGFDLLVAGYPSSHGNSVTLELRRVGREPDAVPVVRRTLAFEDAREGWTHQRVRLAGADTGSLGGPVEARIVAVDGGTGAAGWLGISAPFHEGRHTLLWSLGILGRLALALGAAVTGIVGAGLAMRWRLLHASGNDSMPWWANLALVPLPGTAWLVVTALACWRLAPAVDPRWVAASGLAPLFLFTAGCFIRAQARALARAAEWRVLLIAGLLALLVLGKAQFSSGPAGELYAETISRTLEVGGRSDSRIFFHVVQLVAHGISPFSKQGSGYFAPWSFTSRGPLLGLASSSLALAAGARPPTGMPDQSWLPFDAEGFAVARLVMIVLGVSALLPLFGAAGALLGGGDPGRADRAGLLAVALAALTPFCVHEIYFTWGKLPTAGCLAAVVYGLARGRYLAAGGLCAIGYLCHPLTLLYVPFLGLGALWLAVTRNSRGNRWGHAGWALTQLGGPVLLAFGFWRWVGQSESASNLGQGFFLKYLFMPSSWAAFDFGMWASHRRESLLNTLVPGWLFLVNFADPEVNALGGRSPRIVHWAFQYWNTVPFGLGILGFPVVVKRLLMVARKAPGVFALAAAAPFALFAIYWGAAPSGLMREGLHPWVFALLMLVAWAYLPAGQAPAGEAALLSARAGEVAVMGVLPVLLTSTALPRPAYLWLDGMMFAGHLACLGALAVLCHAVYRGGSRDGSG